MEQLRLQTDKCLENSIAVYLILAWRIHHIAMISRERGDESCEIIYEKTTQRAHALQMMTRMLAHTAGS